MGSFIDGFQDMETRVSIKFSLIHVVLVIRVQRNTWSKTLYYLLLILAKTSMHLNLEAFVSVCCICLVLFDQSFMGIDTQWGQTTPKWLIKT